MTSLLSTPPPAAAGPCVAAVGAAESCSHSLGKSTGFTIGSDAAVRTRLDAAMATPTEILSSRQDSLSLLADELKRRGYLSADDINAILNKANELQYAAA